MSRTGLLRVMGQCEIKQVNSWYVTKSDVLWRQVKQRGGREGWQMALLFSVMVREASLGEVTLS